MMKADSQWMRIAAAVDTVTRQARIGVVRSGHGGSAPRVFSRDQDGWLAPDDEVVARVFEPDDLLDVDRFHGIEPFEHIAAGLIDLAWDERDGRRRQPDPPLSILLHGPSRVAMTLVVHMVAWGLDADLVQVFATAVLPSSNGGSQPIVAPAINNARGRRRSVLFIDQLETLATADRRDVRRQRAMNDLVAETLRPVYGRAPFVIAACAGEDAPDRRLTDRFEHIVFVDLADSDDAAVVAVRHGSATDDAEMVAVRHRSATAVVRTAPTHAHLQRTPRRFNSTMGSAA